MNMENGKNLVVVPKLGMGGGGCWYEGRKKSWDEKDAWRCIFCICKEDTNFHQRPSCWRILPIKGQIYYVGLIVLLIIWRLQRFLNVFCVCVCLCLSLKRSKYVCLPYFGIYDWFDSCILSLNRSTSKMILD